jgi:hypothetical protein
VALVGVKPFRIMSLKSLLIMINTNLEGTNEKISSSI